MFLSVRATATIGTDLLYSVPTKALALVLHVRARNVDWRLTGLLLAGGIPGSLVGLFVFALLRARLGRESLELLLRHGIGIAILAACVGTWYTRYRAGERTATTTRSAAPPTVIAIGLLVGFLVALTSVGAGSVTLPLLLIALPGLTVRRLIGSEIAFAALLIPISAAAHATFGNPQWNAVANLLVGALPGVWIGSRLCSRIGERTLLPIVIAVLAIAGVSLL